MVVECSSPGNIVEIRAERCTGQRMREDMQQKDAFWIGHTQDLIGNLSCGYLHKNYMRLGLPTLGHELGNACLWQLMLVG